MNAQAIWQDQAADPLTFGDFSEKAATLTWEMNRRAVSGYGWAGMFALRFGWDIWHAANAAETLGNLLCVAAALIMAECWRRYRAPPEVPNDAPVVQFLATYRAELRRQKRGTQRIGFYGPMVMVFGMMTAGAGHLAARHALHGHHLLVLAGFSTVLLGVAWSLTALAAQQIQFRIDEVDAALRQKPEGGVG